MEAKTLQRLKHIAKYCEKILLATHGMDNNGILFSMKSRYQARDICSFYLLQIGELVSVIPDELKQENLQIPWKSIKGFRNIVAHRYGTVDIKMLWDIVHKNIPTLNSEIRNILRQEIPNIDNEIATELQDEIGLTNSSEPQSTLTR